MNFGFSHTTHPPIVIHYMFALDSFWNKCNSDGFTFIIHVNGVPNWKEYFLEHNLLLSHSDTTLSALSYVLTSCAFPGCVPFIPSFIRGNICVSRTTTYSHYCKTTPKFDCLTCIYGICYMYRSYSNKTQWRKSVNSEHFYL